MSLWRLELLRLVRTRRAVALLVVYLLFGLLGPVTARYLRDLIELAGDDVEIKVPDPVPPDGMAEYVSNAMQIGIVVTVVVAAGALAVDTLPEMGAFLRTRVPSAWRLLAPRLIVTFAATATAFTLGTLAAWYETWALLGGLEAGDVIAGTAFGVLFLAYVVAVVGAVAQWAKSVLATVMLSLLALLSLPVLGAVEAIGRWMPARLATALADLTAGRHDAGDYVRPAAVTLIATAALIYVALAGLRRREL
jgi:ABC-2 type transport system permease protein